MSVFIFIFILFDIPVAIFYTGLYITMVKDFIEDKNGDKVEIFLICFLGYMLVILWLFTIFVIINIVMLVL